MKIEFSTGWWFDVSEDDDFNYISTTDLNGNQVVLKCSKKGVFRKHWQNLKEQLAEQDDDSIITSWHERLVERLAAVEHDQWISWAKSVLERETGLSDETRERWEQYMVPYDELSEDVKEHDRRWARRVMAVAYEVSDEEVGR